MTDLNSAQIEIPFKVYQEVKQGLEEISTHAFISNSYYKGVCEESFVRLSCEYTIRIYDDQSNAPSNNNNNNKKKNIVKKYSVQLMSQKATIEKSVILFSNNSNKNEDMVDASTKGACLLTNNGFYNLYTSAAGRYLVKLELLVPYLNNKNTGMELTIPQSTNNSVVFQVNQPNSNIKVFNSFPDVDSHQEWLSKHEKESSSTSLVFVKLPTDTHLKIQWTAIEESKKTLESSKTQTVSIKPNIVVQQHTLCSLGEGLLQLKTSFIYKIIAGIISQFNIEIENNISIVNVEGKAIKKWDISNENGGKRILKIDLDYGVENSYELKVFAEYSMGDTTGEVFVSPMICKGEEISRQRGYLGVEARTNIEISDIGNDGLSVADVTEIPKDLQSMAGHPILLSYKFLEPRYLLNLRVKKNSDCSVLLSICEEAHFITTISFSGKNIHQMILSIKNTQQQFLRVHVPFQYEVWSTMMGSTPIKPSLGEGFLMVPLLKPGNLNTDAPVKIEIVLLEKDCAPLSTKKGKLEFIIPKLDLPLRAAFYTLYLPESFSASNFLGNLKNVRHFSATPPSASSPTDDNNNFSNNNDNMIMPQQRKRSSYDYDDDSDGGYESINSSYFSKVAKSGNSMKGKRRAGVIPVKINMPTTSNQLKFEQILVDKDLSVSFDYKVKEVKPRRV
ncbi:hypothetical protein CYY_006920 [Polysphondylium violaceum]|uniref:Uncharacterized protein n=1 Tax=Polysphondylium violaceum TaxID=133409 RepID=A0A8J4V5C3_9MYCE|nr:hypothetical protein CYY_006920 [Polysphondylium violaceum]